jgi:enoyl-CoA hydratase
VSAGITCALDLLDSSPDLRVGVLHGSGSAFCAGMDLTAFAAGEQVRDPSRGFAGIVERPPAKPLIAAVEGWARGGGVFRLPHRLPHAVAMELIVTGAPLDAPRAEHFGLVNRLGGGCSRHRTRPRASPPSASAATRYGRTGDRRGISV